MGAFKFRNNLALRCTNVSLMLQLGKNRSVQVREFRGKTLIDIREYYLDSEGEKKPGKKGTFAVLTFWGYFGLSIVSSTFVDCLFVCLFFDDCFLFDDCFWLTNCFNNSNFRHFADRRSVEEVDGRGWQSWCEVGGFVVRNCLCLCNNICLSCAGMSQEGCWIYGLSYCNVVSFLWRRRS